MYRQMPSATTTLRFFERLKEKESFSDARLLQLGQVLWLFHVRRFRQLETFILSTLERDSFASVIREQ